MESNLYVENSIMGKKGGCKDILVIGRNLLYELFKNIKENNT